MAAEQIPKLRVLVADDMQSMRGIIKAALKSAGVVDIVDVPDGEIAIQHLKSKPTDLVVCDWDMPKVSGLEVLQWVRDNEALKTLPFILLTANNQAGHVKEAILAGVTDYITKPFAVSYTHLTLPTKRIV